MVDFRCTGRVEGIGVQVEGASLERGLEDIGDVGEKDIVEEIAELDVKYKHGFINQEYHCLPKF